MKKDELYKYYIVYLNARLSSGKLNYGSYSLYMICDDSFKKFKDKFLKNKSFVRDLKIDKILNKL